MFAPGDLETPTKSAPPLENRAIGLLVLFAGMLLCFILVVAMDQQVFIPFNVTQAVTQTWVAQHPELARTPTRRGPRVTRTPTPLSAVMADNSGQPDSPSSTP